MADSSGQPSKDSTQFSGWYNSLDFAPSQPASFPSYLYGLPLKATTIIIGLSAGNSTSIGSGFIKATAYHITAALTQAISFVTSYIPGGTEYFQSFSASVTDAGSQVEETFYHLTASLTDAGVFVKRTAHNITASVTTSDTFKKLVSHLMTASVGTSNTFKRVITYIFSASEQGTGTTTKLLPRTLVAASLTTSTTFLKQAQKVFSAALTTATTFATLYIPRTGMVFYQSLSAGINVIGSAVRRISKLQTATISDVGSTVKNTSHGLTSTETTSDTMTKRTSKVLAATVTTTVNITRQINKLIASAASYVVRLITGGPPTLTLSFQIQQSTTIVFSNIIQTVAVNFELDTSETLTFTIYQTS